MTQEDIIKELEAGVEIGFRYKGGRHCTGILIEMHENSVTLKLTKDYIGKNDEWEAGELKAFNIKEMKKIQLLTKIKQQ